MSANHTEIAFAKINLALHVRNRRADGFHELDTLFAFAADGDMLSATPAPAMQLIITGPFADGLSADADNLVLKAAQALHAIYPDKSAYALTLDKRLPVASGIGGGSADAAATLRLLCRLWSVTPSEAQLSAMALDLGSDVPACLVSRTCRGRGRGEHLEPIDDAALAGLPLLLVNPRLPLSTGPVFRQWDGVDRGALLEGDVMQAVAQGRNDLEAPAVALLPAISDVLVWLAKQPGVSLSRMSGSGATCFALFGTITARDQAAVQLQQDYPAWWCFKSALR